MRTLVFMVAMLSGLTTAVAQTWETNSEVDFFTDTATATAYLPSSQGIFSWLGIFCTDNVLEVLIQHEDSLLDSDSVVTIRVGKQQSENQNWIISVDGYALFSPYPYELLTDLLNDTQDKFAIRVWSLDGYELDSLFDTSRINPAMKVIREAGCLPQEN